MSIPLPKVHLPVPSTRTPSTSSDPSSSKSLTPQRKHRKLLKDGSGSEVWPEDIERVFVEGLRQYWTSPWQNQHHIRGRNRWRNHFLVDYLQKAGIARTKKQVASHIQVLRNMWKGEPEFHLVAGGDELCTEDRLSVKMEEFCDPSTPLPYLDYDDAGTNSTTSSPNVSPPEFIREFPPSPGRPSYNVKAESHSPTTILAFPSASLYESPRGGDSPVNDHGYLTSPLSTGAPTYPFSTAVLQSSTKHAPPNSLNSMNRGFDSAPLLAPSYPLNLRAVTPGFGANRVTSVCLMADGMTPLTVKVDALAPPSPFPGVRTPIALLSITLSISSINDATSPSSLHGFSGNICLANVWNSSARCITRTFNNGTCVAEESGALQVSSIDVGTVITALPPSSLDSCRWLDPECTSRLTQEIVVDNQTLLHLDYALNRLPGMPSAQVLGYVLGGHRSQSQSRPARSASTPSPLPSHWPSNAPPQVAYSQSVTQPHSSYTRPTSLSYALTPTNKRWP